MSPDTIAPCVALPLAAVLWAVWLIIRRRQG